MSALDFADLTYCANKQRKDGYLAPNGYNAEGRMQFLWVTDRMNPACKYDRKAIDPACANADCERRF